MKIIMQYSIVQLYYLFFYPSPRDNMQGFFLIYFYFYKQCCSYSPQASQAVLVVRNLSANAGEVGDSSLIPGSGRAPAEGDNNPLQYSCPEIPQTEDPGGLQFIGLQRDTPEVTSVCSHACILFLVYIEYQGV